MFSFTAASGYRTGTACEERGWWYELQDDENPVCNGVEKAKAVSVSIDTLADGQPTRDQDYEVGTGGV